MVEVRPMLNDLASLEAANVHSRDDHMPPGRCDASERTSVGTAEGPATRHLVAHGDAVFDGQVSVRECCADSAEPLLEGFRARTTAEQAMVDKVLVNQLVQQREITFVQPF